MPRTLTIGICTYKRTDLVEELIDDIQNQTQQLQELIFVDGDPSSGQVLELLRRKVWAKGERISYIPSNYANLSYQRYLGWKAAQKEKPTYLLYLDDDLRIYSSEAIEKLLVPLQDDQNIVGETCIINMGALGEKFQKAPAFVDQRSRTFILPRWLQFLRSSSRLKIGGLTPAGDRISPEGLSKEQYSYVEWLRGGVMLYRMNRITQDCFIEDLFALDHIHCGKGEDTILSRRVMRQGKLILNHLVVIDHPNNDLPKTYPISAYHLAYATAFSRRFLNDHYRITEPPRFIDRIYLFKSYLGNNIINFYRALVYPAKHRFAFARGYFAGSLRGVVQKPTAKNLTPDIHWWKDAEEALKQIVVV